MHKFIFPIVVLLSTAAVAMSGDSTRTMIASRTTAPPKIDGMLDDTIWQSAKPHAYFVQYEPINNVPPTEQTEARILFDDDAIYVGVMCYDSEPENIVSRVTRRDRFSESDRVWIAFDTYHDHLTSFYFITNVSGVKQDAHVVKDGNDEDYSWDAVWDVETKILPNGWSAEFRIPLSQIRFVPSEKMVWGIGIRRDISRKQETDISEVHLKSDPGIISRFSILEGLSITTSPRRLEILPFGVSRLESNPPSTADADGRRLRFDGGLDMKYGLTQNFTLDATFNPDFGQVEADEVVLNLTTFETFYPEKRPFFLEGARILQFVTFGGDAGPGLFYSRRIGRGISDGEADTPSGGFIREIPSAVRIIGAAKITGKTSDGISLGLLEAVTKEESALVVDPLGKEESQLLEPLASYSMIRVRKDILENSYVGFLASSVNKKTRLPAFTAGADWQLRLDEGYYHIEGFFAGSHTTNRSMDRISGTAGKLQIAKAGGEHWTGYISSDFTSKGYNINDIGFFRSPNDYGVVGQLSYKEEAAAEVVRRWGASAFVHWRSNFDRVILSRDLSLNGRMQLLNYWGGNVFAAASAEAYDHFETRGNGLYKRQPSYSVGASMYSDERNSLVGEFSHSFTWNAQEYSNASTALELQYKPVTWADLEVEVEHSRRDNQEAWMTNITDASGNKVSIFGDRSTREWDFTIRNTTMFTRDLSLQLYAQIFFAKGHYEHPRALLDAHSFGTTTYNETHDFNEQAVNLNVVLRWEYLPGSAMYLVWTQARSGSLSNYYNPFSKDFSYAFDAPSYNVFLFKISYWLNG